MLIWTWVTLVVFLCTIWVAVARELSNALLGYLVQTGLVSVLYGIDAVRTHDTSMWIAFGGLIVVRGLIVPSLVWMRLPRSSMHQRSNLFLGTPTFGVSAAVLISLVTGFIVTAWHAHGALNFGFALATLFTGIAVTSLTHDAGRQMVGLLCAENGVDTAIAAVLSRVSVMADYVIFIDIALVVVLFVVLIGHYGRAGSFNLRDFHQLRG